MTYKDFEEDEGLRTRKRLYDPRLLYVLVLAVLFIATISPPIFAPPVEPWAQDFYDTVETLQPGDVVIFNWGVTNKPDIFEYLPTMLRHVLSKDASIVWLTCDTNALPLAEAAKQYVWGEDWRSHDDINYGVNFVDMGYIPALEAGTVIWLNDMTGMATDNYGTAIADLPLIVGLTGFDIDIIIDSRYFNMAMGGMLLNQANDDYGYNFDFLFFGSAQVAIGTAKMYYETGVLAGICAGMRSGYSLTILSGFAGFCTPYIVALTLVGVITVVGLVIINGWRAVGGGKQ